MNSMTRLAAAAVAALALGAAAQVDAQKIQVIPVSAKNADQILKPGDVMIKLLNQQSQATSVGISVSEGAINQFLGGFSEAARKGNPAAVHVAMYVGNGQTAEAHGKTSEDKEGVSLRNIEHHAGYLWYVFRPNDAGLGAAAADVARRWANFRMAYRLPFEVALHNSNFGSKAQAEALGYGHAFGVPGGPPGTKDMFCSEFVIAAYQAAVVRGELARNPALKAKDVRMYPGMDLQASYTSPLVLHGHLRTSHAGFQQMPYVIVQKAK
jgi:hypothetical protein